MATAARDAVISTVELLELILLHVDMSTLLTSAQLVNHAWNTLITQHAALQKALFLKPEDSRIYPSVPFSELSQEDRLKRMEERRPHPLLAKLLPPLFPGDMLVDPMTELDVDAGGEKDGEQAGSHRINQASIESLPVWEKPGFRDAFLREGASWRRMFTHQPPYESMSLIESATAMGGSGVTHKRYRCKRYTIAPPSDLTGENTAGGEAGRCEGSNFLLDGVRMATFYDEVHSILERTACRLIPVNRVMLSRVQQNQAGAREGTTGKLFKDAVEGSDLLLCSHRVISCVHAIVESEWGIGFGSNDHSYFGDCETVRFVYSTIEWD